MYRLQDYPHSTSHTFIFTHHTLHSHTLPHPYLIHTSSFPHLNQTLHSHTHPLLIIPSSIICIIYSMARTSGNIQDMIRLKEAEKTRGTKRSAIPLSLTPPALKKRKIHRKSSSTCDATPLTHKMVLKDVRTPQLLQLLGEFLCRRCKRLPDLSPDIPTMWLCRLDKFLIRFKAQEKPFICPGSIVFLYMLCRDSIPAEVGSMEELRVVLLTCLYVSYAYTGHEIGYPVLPFIYNVNKQAFWKRVLDITLSMSHKMLEIAMSPKFFAQVSSDLQERKDH